MAKLQIEEAASPQKPFLSLDWVALGLIAVALFFVYYFRCSQMGLYEDDYVEIATGINSNLPAVWKTVSGWLVDWPNGRALGHGIAVAAAWALFRTGGLTSVYLIPFSIILLNASLLYRILRNLTTNYAAFLGALTLALLPTDTQRLILHNSPQVMCGSTSLLAGFLLYRAGRPGWCYASLALGMLCHESSALAFLAIPFLYFDFRKENAGRFARHAVLCLATIAGLMMIRTVIMTEARALTVSSNPLDTVRRMAVSMATGTKTHLYLLVRRIADSLQTQDRLWNLYVLFVLGIIAAGYFLFRADARRDGNGLLPGRNRRLAITGVLCFCLPYLVYVTAPYWPSSHVAGRIASVHTASGVGVAILLALAADIAGRLPVHPGFRRMAQAALAICLALLLGWGYVVQLQYRESWRNQRAFWQALAPQLGDVQDHTIVLVEHRTPQDFPQTWVIGSNSWADSIVLRNLYRFPPAWRRDPRVFDVTPGWVNDTKVVDGRIQWLMPAGDWPPAWVELEPGNVVLVRADHGRPQRVEGILEVRGVELPLKAAPVHAAEPPFPHRALYPYLLER